MQATPYPAILPIATDLDAAETLRAYGRRVRVRKPNRREQLARLTKRGER